MAHPNPQCDSPKSLKRKQEDSSSDEMEWEEVAFQAPTLAPLENVEFTIASSQDTDPQKSGKKVGISKRDRTIRLLEHKVHLLCLLAFGLNCNALCDNQTIRAFAMSVMPKSISKSTKIRDILVYFKRQMTVDLGATFDLDTEISFDGLMNCFANLSAVPYYYVAVLFVAASRSVGFESRLSISLHPIPLSFSKRKQPCSNSVEMLAEVNLGSEWVIVDPVTGFIGAQIVDYKSVSISPVGYVVAFDAHFGCKEVTKRYTSNWGSIASRLRIPERAGEMGWWSMTLWLLSKSQRTYQDLHDDIQIASAEFKEKMPTSMAKFLNHPMYALEKQCKATEVIFPNDKNSSIGVFKGQLVFPRQNVQKLATEMHWKLQGRAVRADQTPHSRSKSKTGNSDEESQERELFGYWQTEEIKRPKISNWELAVNKFGNIELFHDNMLPIGAVHIHGLEDLI